MLRYFTFGGANGSSMNTEWVRIADGFQNWQLTVQVHSRISTTTATVQLQTSWDGSSQTALGSAVALATVGLNTQDITTGMGPMVRLAFSATADSVVVLSVWLTPKSE